MRIALKKPYRSESDRLKALREYQILDTEAEKTFDDLTKLASLICGTPISLISLVDEHRQWFKSRVGIEANETPREIAFCHHAIQESGIFEVADAQTDPRFKTNPLVTGDPNLRFYAGQPLVTTDGHALGTLCVVDLRPRQLSQEQREALALLANQVMTQIELRKELLHKKETLIGVGNEARLLESFFDSSELLMGVVEIDSRERAIHHVADNQATLKFLEQSFGPGADAQKRALSVYHANMKLWRDNYLKAKEWGKPVTFDYLYQAHDRAAWLHVTVNYIGRVTSERDQYSYVAEDVTEARKLENDLRIERERFKLAVDGSNAGLWDWDITRGSVYFSKNYMEMLGYAEGELPSTLDTWTELTHPEDRDHALRTLQDYFDGGEYFSLEHRLRTKRGNYRWILSRGTCVRDPEGRPVRMTGWHIDVHDERVAKEAVREQKERFETIMNNIPVMLTLHDSHGRITWANREYERTTLRKIVEGEPFDVINESRFSPEKRNFIAKQILSPDGEWRDADMELQDGRRVPCSWANVPLSQGRSVGIGVDISLRRQQEQIIREQQIKIIASAKMSSLGEMASGVAHEINNPLAIIHARADQLKEMLGEDQLDREKILWGLERIRTTADRIARVVKGLRSFARNGERDPFALASVSQIVEETLELCREKFKKRGIEIKVTELPNIEIECRAVQISQVLLNLLSNAYDAIQGNQDAWVEIGIRQTGEQVEFLVRDAGSGIRPEVAAKIMQPFFTTKEVGEGTGLGLSIAKGIVEDHRGRLEYVAESPNTLFKFILPVQQAAVANGTVTSIKKLAA